jgi:hypothetical protein
MVTQLEVVVSRHGGAGSEVAGFYGVGRCGEGFIGVVRILVGDQRAE